MTISVGKPILDRYVESIWTYEGHGLSTTDLRLKFFADGRPGIMFQQGEYPMLINDGGKVSTIFLYGQTISPVQFSSRGSFRIIVFFLRPDAAYQLFKIPANELTDSCFNLAEETSGRRFSLSERLLNTNDLRQKINIIEDFLIDQIVRNATHFETEINYAVQLIQQSLGNQRIFDLARTLQMSLRTLERRFEQQVGVTPKMYSSISKFNAAMQRIEAGHFDSLTALAHDLGYADQSHFIRWFKHYTGETPLAFVDRLKNTSSSAF